MPATLADHLRSQRTLTQSQVDLRTAVHDSHDLTPSERSKLLTNTARPANRK